MMDFLMRLGFSIFIVCGLVGLMATALGFVTAGRVIGTSAGLGLIIIIMLFIWGDAE